MTANQPTYDEPAMDVCTCASLRRATRLVTQQYDAALRPAGLRATQFTILSVLINKGQVKQSELADVLGMEGTTLTRNLQPLLKNGWIRIDRGLDQRVRLISVTKQGRQVREDAMPMWRQVQSRFVNELGQGQWSALVGALSSAAEIAEEH